MKNRNRPAPAPVEDPNGYVLSLNSGDDLEHYDTFEAAVANANSAIREGYKMADVWHGVGAHSVDIDYDLGVEYSARPA